MPRRRPDYQRLTGGQVPDDDLSDEALYDRAAAENEESFPISVVATLAAIAKALDVEPGDLING